MNDSNLRTLSFGEDYSPTLVDKFGVWLSGRQLRKASTFNGKVVADLGCGYHATFFRTILHEIKTGYLIDVSLASEILKNPKVTAFQGDFFSGLEKIPDNTVDVLMCISVLEHLWDPELALKEFYRVLAPNGVCLINVPTWLGKSALEFSAFHLGTSPSAEMDDHKMYYDKKSLWPLLVRANFKPSLIKMFYHKFYLNLFVKCIKQ